MCSSPFYSVLFFDAEHKQLAENVIQSHDDELYRKLRDPVIPVQNIYQQCHAGHFDKESGNPRTEKFQHFAQFISTFAFKNELSVCDISKKKLRRSMRTYWQPSVEMGLADPERL